MSDNDRSAQPCGCDEGAHWTCTQHSQLVQDPPAPTQELTRPTNPQQYSWPHVSEIPDASDILRRLGHIEQVLGINPLVRGAI